MKKAITFVVSSAVISVLLVWALFLSIVATPKDILGTDIVMCAIDENVEMYRYLPARKYKDVLGCLFTFANAKRTYEAAVQCDYSEFLKAAS